MKKILKNTAIVFSAVLIVLFGAVWFYLNDFYKVDTESVNNFKTSGNYVKEVTDDNTIVVKAEGSDTGFIFYPGGKVEYTAYEPLLWACAEKGITCFMPQMPFNLAVFNVNAAEKIQSQHPEIKHWYIGGHSLGGAMSASYLDENAENFEGLILLAAYSTNDISDEDIKVLSVYGSEDKVLNYEKYIDSKENLPENFSEFVIDGGSHSYFGMYGVQKGDGKAQIEDDEQINKTAQLIYDFIY